LRHPLLDLVPADPPGSRNRAGRDLCAEGRLARARGPPDDDQGRGRAAVPSKPFARTWPDLHPFTSAAYTLRGAVTKHSPGTRGGSVPRRSVMGCISTFFCAHFYPVCAGHLSYCPLFFQLLPPCPAPLSHPMTVPTALPLVPFPLCRPIPAPQFSARVLFPSFAPCVNACPTVLTHSPHLLAGRRAGWTPAGLFPRDGG